MSNGQDNHRQNGNARKPWGVGNIACQRLLLVTFAALVLADPTLATVVAPAPRAFANTNRRSRHSVGAVDGDKVTSQIMLATERPAARLVMAYVGLSTVRVVSLNVGLEVIRPGKCWETSVNKSTQDTIIIAYLGGTTGTDISSWGPGASRPSSEPWWHC